MNKRFGSGALFALMAAILLGGVPSAWAQDIMGFYNGYLTFANESTSLYYRVEFKPNLTDPVEWDGAFRDLRNIQSSDAEVTVPVGVFYRVVGRDTPWVTGTALAADILSGKTAYVNDEKLTGTMPNVGKTNMPPSTTVQTIPQGYHDGTGSVAGDTNLATGNIRSGVTIFGVAGKTEVVDTASGDAEASDILADRKAWVKGAELTGTHSGAHVPKTGQTFSFRGGDDGDLKKGVAWPDPRFTDNDDGTVTDKLTGLIWVKAPHDREGNSGSNSWSWAVDFCYSLNFAGHSDWRLPNVRELQSLIDHGQLSPALPSGHPFTGVHPNLYWSSTVYGDGATMEMWYVNLNCGHVHYKNETYENRVWPVRVAQGEVRQESE